MRTPFAKTAAHERGSMVDVIGSVTCAPQTTHAGTPIAT
jgi:hypothetical protein